MQTQEITKTTANGWTMLPLLIVLAIGVGLAWWGVIRAASIWAILSMAVITAVWAVLLGGFFTLEPNQAAVLVLFGKYKGTCKESGFHWANPFLAKHKVSLRARNLNGNTIKVNDARGNPIEIAAVVVWKVQDTAQAVFDVDNYESYVTIQSEAAVRHLASIYPYDTTEHETLSLRGSMEEVCGALQKELQERVGRAGIHVEDARLSHLAYAPEIAGAMLRRQQADAIVAARTRIVDGAVGMVELALQRLEKDQIIELDSERKAAMVSNLLVVLCGEKAADPVVNTGSLYT